MKNDEQNHDALIKIFIQEYVQYVQTMGFSVINHRGGKPDGHFRHRKYLQKCLPSGVLLLEIGVVPPFFVNRLYALEEARLPTKKVTCGRTISHPVSGLLQEAEKVN